MDFGTDRTSIGEIEMHEILLPGVGKLDSTRHPRALPAEEFDVIVFRC